MQPIRLLLIGIFFVIVRAEDESRLEADVEITAPREPEGAAPPSAGNFYLNPAALRSLGSMGVVEFLAQKKLMQDELVQYLAGQISLDEDGEPEPGQRVCLPLILTTRTDQIPPHINYNSFIMRTVKEITGGTFVQNLMRGSKAQVPTPDYHRVVDYQSERTLFMDLGPDFALSKSSFTVSATVRLRGNTTSRGSRVLSMRDSSNQGWELVVPSYYGRQISFYSSADSGHFDYGKAYIPADKWTVIGITFDRETYPNDVAKITTYVDGVRDGEPTLITFKGGDLSSMANLTIGNFRDEQGQMAKGRIDYHEPISEWKRYKHQFLGDIKEFSIWHRALTRDQMRRHAAPQLRKLRPATQNCKNGFKPLGCSCFKVFNQLAGFDDASKVCASFGGTLAMPKDDRTQTFLEVLMQRSKNRFFWIGLNDVKAENEYYWADGTVFTWRTDYHRFVRGKPDKTYKTEDCFEQEKGRREFVWNDEHCMKLNPFICQTAIASCDQQ